MRIKRTRPKAAVLIYQQRIVLVNIITKEKSVRDITAVKQEDMSKKKGGTSTAEIYTKSTSRGMCDLTSAMHSLPRINTDNQVWNPNSSANFDFTYGS